MNRLLPCTLALALPLIACDRSGEGTSVSINADAGNVLGSVDGRSGAVKVDMPGFSGKFNLPKIQLDAGDFDLNGVRLYPGSTIDTVNIGTTGKDAGMNLRFTSPASPDQVRGWFKERLTNAGFTLKSAGQGLTGTTDEKKPFRLDLTSDGPSRAKGTITLGG